MSGRRLPSFPYTADEEKEITWANSKDDLKKLQDTEIIKLALKKSPNELKQWILFILQNIVTSFFIKIEEENEKEKKKILSEKTTTKWCNALQNYIKTLGTINTVISNENNGLVERQYGDVLDDLALFNFLPHYFQKAKDIILPRSRKWNKKNSTLFLTKKEIIYLFLRNNVDRSGSEEKERNLWNIVYNIHSVGAKITCAIDNGIWDKSDLFGDSETGNWKFSFSDVYNNTEPKLTNDMFWVDEPKDLIDKWINNKAKNKTSPPQIRPQPPKGDPPSDSTDENSDEESSEEEKNELIKERDELLEQIELQKKNQEEKEKIISTLTKEKATLNDEMEILKQKEIEDEKKDEIKIEACLNHIMQKFDLIEPVEQEKIITIDIQTIQKTYQIDENHVYYQTFQNKTEEILQKIKKNIKTEIKEEEKPFEEQFNDLWKKINDICNDNEKNILDKFKDKEKPDTNWFFMVDILLHERKKPIEWDKEPWTNYKEHNESLLEPKDMICLPTRSHKKMEYDSQKYQSIPCTCYKY